MANKDSISQTLIVATILCVACSVLVSSAAVGLRETQQLNILLDKKRNILLAGGLIDGNEAGREAIEQAFSAVEAKVIDLASGDFVEDVEAESYDQFEAAKNPAESILLPTDKDLGGIRRREKLGVVYLVKKDGKLDQLILPFRGMGLWATMYGFFAVRADLNTIGGLTFYQHGETPGLGGEVDSEWWKSQWAGKKIFDDKGEIRIEVLKGKVRPRDPSAEFKVDGLSGATITTRGVSEMLRFWVGTEGYAPFFAKMKKTKLRSSENG